eukprot:1161371-Pelagomonas_calceolata.AAC.12
MACMQDSRKIEQGSIYLGGSCSNARGMAHMQEMVLYAFDIVTHAVHHPSLCKCDVPQMYEAGIRYAQTYKLGTLRDKLIPEQCNECTMSNV